MTLFKSGMKPLTFSEIDYEENGIAWSDETFNALYFKNDIPKGPITLPKLPGTPHTLHSTPNPTLRRKHRATTTQNTILHHPKLLLQIQAPKRPSLLRIRPSLHHHPPLQFPPRNKRASSAGFHKRSLPGRRWSGNSYQSFHRLTGFGSASPSI